MNDDKKMIKTDNKIVSCNLLFIAQCTNISKLPYKFLCSKSNSLKLICIYNLPVIVDTSSPDKDTINTSEISSIDISDGEESISVLSMINFQGQRVIAKAAWEKVRHIRLHKIPHDINSLEHYVLSDKERHKLLEK